MAEKILVCNGAYLGDVILATSVLLPLKKAFPQAELGFLAGSWALPVVEDHSLIDTVHLYDHPRQNRAPLPLKVKKRRGRKTFQKAFLEIQEKKYDIAFDLYSLYALSMGGVLACASIPERVGFWPSRSCYFYTKKVLVSNFMQHTVDSHKNLLAGYGIEENHLEEFRPYLNYKSPLPPNKSPYNSYIVLHMGAGGSRKKWNLPAWKQVAHCLEKEGIPLIFLGKGSEEEREIQEVTQGLRCFTNLCNQLSWKEVVSVIAKAKIVIGLDSMAAHLTAALNVPGVFIYGGYSLVERWKPFNPSCHILTPLRTLSINTITPESVVQKARTLL